MMEALKYKEEVVADLGVEMHFFEVQEVNFCYLYNRLLRPPTAALIEPYWN